MSGTVQKSRKKSIRFVVQSYRSFYQSAASITLAVAFYKVKTSESLFPITLIKHLKSVPCGKKITREFLILMQTKTEKEYQSDRRNKHVYVTFGTFH